MSRNSDLAKIHMGKKQLGLVDETYRGLLSDMFGVDSAGDLSNAQRWSLIKHLEGLGAEFSRKHQKRAPVDPQAKKIKALWSSLHRAGVVRDGSDRALDTYIMRQVKVRSLAWLNIAQASAVIESLKKWKEREGLGHDD